MSFDADSGWSIASPGALTEGPVKPMLHAFYPADGWPEPEISLDYTGHTGDQAEESLPVFARDYDRMIRQAEALLVHQAGRDLPELSLVGEGVRLLAQVVESTILTRNDLEGPPGYIRIALATLALLALRGARACVLLIEPGYVPEAGVMLNRVTSAAELGQLVAGDLTGGIASRFLEGAGLNELEPDTWSSIAESIAANIEQLPPLGLVDSPLGPRPGLGFAGARQLQTAHELVLDAAYLLSEMALTCGQVLLGGTAPELFAKRLLTLRAETAAQMRAAPEDTTDQENRQGHRLGRRRSLPAGACRKWLGQGLLGRLTDSPEPVDVQRPGQLPTARIG